MGRGEIILHNTVAGKRWHYLLWVCKRICGKLWTLIVNVWGVYEQLYPKSDGQENVLDMDVSSFQFLLPCFSTWLCFSEVRSTIFMVIYGVYWHYINLLTETWHMNSYSHYIVADGLQCHGGLNVFGFHVGKQQHQIWHMIPWFFSTTSQDVFLHALGSR